MADSSKLTHTMGDGVEFDVLHQPGLNRPINVLSGDRAQSIDVTLEDADIAEIPTIRMEDFLVGVGIEPNRLRYINESVKRKQAKLDVLLEEYDRAKSIKP